MNNKPGTTTMAPIVQKLDAVLKADGFTVICTESTTGGHGQTVNRLEYMRDKEQRVYIFTHERETP
jgi:hypothetical protein